MGMDLLHTLFAAIPLGFTSGAFANCQRKFGLIATMAIIASPSYFIRKQDGCQNCLREDHRANRQVLRRHHGVSRSGMVDKPQSIGDIDGVHDGRCEISEGYLRLCDSTRLWLNMATLMILPHVI